MRRSPIVQTVAVSTIGMSMLVLGIFLTVLFNVDRVTERWSDETTVVAFLQDDVDDARLADLAQIIEGWDEIEAVRVTSRQQALVAFRASLGEDARLLDGIDPSLLPASVELVVDPAHRTPELLKSLGERVRGVPGIGGVDEVAHGQTLADRARALRRALRIGGLVLVVLVMLSVVFIISNTARLTLFARADELEIMNLVGATSAFIRAPIYIEGALQGLLGATAALIALKGIFELVPGGGGLSLLPAQFVFLPSWVLVVFTLGAAVVGVVAGHLTAGRFLRNP